MRFKILVILILLISCNSEKNKEINELKSETFSLKKKNDSLTNILKELNNKYIFDSISIKFESNKKDSFKEGDNYEADLYIVANNLQEFFFVKYDTIKERKKVNERMLKSKEGVYKLTKKLEKGQNWIYTDLYIESQYGKSKHATIRDLVKVK